MANRYNKYNNVDYVHMPIEAYQMALGDNEAKRLQELSSQKEQLDSLNAVESSFNPDSELKKDLISGVYKDIQGLSNKNLRAPDTLLNLNKILSNPDLINGLSDIQANTILAKKRKAEVDDYLKTNGNDINTSHITDQEAAYNKLGKEGFKSNFLAGEAPGKFLDIEKETREAMKEVKDSGYKYDTLAGGWIRTQGEKGVSLTDLLAQVNPVLRDPKYAQQLQQYGYYEMRKWGDPSDPQSAIANYNKAHGDDAIAHVNDATTHLNSFLAQRAQLLKTGGKGVKDQIHLLDKNIEDTRNLITGFTNQSKEYANDTRGRKLQDDVLQNLAMGSVSPLAHKETEDLIRPNEYGLINARSSQSLHNSLVLEDQKQRNRMDMLKMKQAYSITGQDVNVTPDMTTVIAGVNPDGSQKVVPGFVLSEKGGFESGKIRSTMMGLINNVDQAYDKDNKLITLSNGAKGSVGGSGKTVKEVVINEINNGTAKLIPIGSTGEYSIESPTQGAIRISMDEGTKNYPTIASLQTVANLKPGERKTLPMSLDGKTVSNVIVDKVSDKDAKYYTPQIDDRAQINGKPNPAYGQEAPFLAADRAFSKLNNLPHVPQGTPAQMKQFMSNYMNNAKGEIAGVLSNLLGVKVQADDVHKFNITDGIVVVDAHGKIYDSSGPDDVPQAILTDPRTRIIEVQGEPADNNDVMGMKIKNIRIRPLAHINQTQSQIDGYQWSRATVDPLGPFHHLAKSTKTTSSASSEYQQSESAPVNTDTPDNEQ